MTNRPWLSFGVLCVLTGALVGCDKLGIGQHESGPSGAPSEEELQKIHYMSSDNSGPQGRKLYTHLEQAKTCADLELAVRWNRPPNIESGPFHKKMVYLTSSVPSDLPKNSEVFIRGKIERGEILPSGVARWYVKMKDGTRVQVIETADYFEKQEQTQEGQPAAIVNPLKAHRAFCGHGVYAGAIGKDPDAEARIPLVSMLFAMDRSK